MANIAAVRDHVVLMLNAGLSRALSYHNVHHTLDVATQSAAIAHDEGITNRQQLRELQAAAFFHDSGFMFTYDGHEEKSCAIACEELPAFGFDVQAIDRVCAIIMATRVPQAPKSKLEEIICDADLDYLGRPDFFETGDRLRREMITYKLISDQNDWDERQLNFLQSHRYFTPTSRRKRLPGKLEFIGQLLAIKKNKRSNQY